MSYPEGALPQKDQRKKEPIPFPCTINGKLAEYMAEFARNSFEKDGQTRRITYYEEFLTPEVNFMVYRYRDTWEFQLTDQKHSAIEFVVSDAGERLDITHRLVLPSAKEWGVNGTLFLKKMEAYLQFLRRKKLVEEKKPLGLNAGQEQVIEWGLRNGFRFEREEDGELYDAITKKEKDGYVREVADEKADNGMIRTGYIMTREAYAEWRRENEEIRAANLKALEKDQKPSIKVPRLSLRFQLVKMLPNV